MEHVVPYRNNLASAMLQVEDNYRFHIRQFVEWLGNRAVDGALIFDYIVELNQSPYSASTKRVKRQALKKRLRQLKRMDMMGSELSRHLDQFLKDLDEDPRTKCPTINQAGIGSDKVINEIEYRHLLANARSAKQRCFIKFLWATGCRVSEMVGIRRTDWEDGHKTVRLRIWGKGSKERIIRIPTPLFDEIRDTFGGEEWLFETGRGKPYSRTYVSDQIAKLGRTFLGRRISAHTFRHSFATRMIRDTHKTQAVSKYLGHSSVAITLSLYVHEQLDDTELFSELEG